MDNFVLIKIFGGRWEEDKINRQTDNYSRIVRDIKEKEAGKYLCPDKGGKKKEKKKVCGRKCTYCMSSGHQVRVVFLEKRKGWNGRRLFPKKLDSELVSRISRVVHKIRQLNDQQKSFTGCVSGLKLQTSTQNSTDVKAVS